MLRLLQDLSMSSALSSNCCIIWRWRRLTTRTTRRRRRKDEADNGGKPYVHVIYMQLSSYRMTDPQFYNKAYVVVEPFLL